MTFSTTMYFQLHFIELKYNSFIFIFSINFLFLICYYFSNQLIYIFIKPFLNFSIFQYFIYTDITEIFFLHFFLALTISCIIIIPFLFLQIWIFFLPGLTKKENIKILKFVIIFFIFNFIFIPLVLIYIIPYFWIYFYHFNTISNYLIPIYFEPKLNNYFYFIYIFFLYLIFFLLKP